MIQMELNDQQALSFQNCMTLRNRRYKWCENIMNECWPNVCSTKSLRLLGELQLGPELVESFCVNKVYLA